jgi:hypothetical protein
MDETLFYVFGIALVLSAIGLSAIGLRNESFPPSAIAIAGLIAYFAVLVGATTTFAVLNARDDQRKRNAEQAEAAATQPAPSGATTTGSTTTTGAAPTGKATTVKLAAEARRDRLRHDPAQRQGGKVTIDFDNRPRSPTTSASRGRAARQIGCSDTISQHRVAGRESEARQVHLPAAWTAIARPAWKARSRSTSPVWRVCGAMRH